MLACSVLIIKRWMSNHIIIVKNNEERSQQAHPPIRVQGYLMGKLANCGHDALSIHSPVSYSPQPDCSRFGTDYRTFTQVNYLRSGPRPQSILTCILFTTKLAQLFSVTGGLINLHPMCFQTSDLHLVAAYLQIHTKC